MRVSQLNRSFSFERFAFILSEPLTLANPDEARVFACELDRHLKQHEELTAAVVTGTIPTMEELAVMRTSDTNGCGIGVLFAAVRYALFSIARSKFLTVSSRQLSPDLDQNFYKIFDIPLVKLMCVEAKIIAWLTNDLMDFKGVNHSNYNVFIMTNSITSLFKQSNCTSLQEAVNRVYRRLHRGIDSFESQAKSLVGHKYDLPDGSQGEVTETEAETMRDILRSIFVGNFIWMSSLHEKL